MATHIPQMCTRCGEVVLLPDPFLCPGCQKSSSPPFVDSTATAEDVELMLQTIIAQQRMIVAYRTGQRTIPEWVFETLAKARTKGWIK